jgi:hypothetical protein
MAKTRSPTKARTDITAATAKLRLATGDLSVYRQRLTQK